MCFAGTPIATPGRRVVVCLCPRGLRQRWCFGASNGCCMNKHRWGPILVGKYSSMHCEIQTIFLFESIRTDTDFSQRRASRWHPPLVGGPTGQTEAVFTSKKVYLGIVRQASTDAATALTQRWPLSFHSATYSFVLLSDLIYIRCSFRLPSLIGSCLVARVLWPCT